MYHKQKSRIHSKLQQLRSCAHAKRLHACAIHRSACALYVISTLNISLWTLLLALPVLRPVLTACKNARQTNFMHFCVKSVLTVTKSPHKKVSSICESGCFWSDLENIRILLWGPRILTKRDTGRCGTLPLKNGLEPLKTPCWTKNISLKIRWNTV